MTIGVGFLCSDGIVICSDREISISTGGKSEQCKIFSCKSPIYEMIFSYAGDPDAAQIMFRKISEELQQEMDKAKGRVPTDKARNALEKIYKNKNTKGLETLIGMKIQYCPTFLFKTYEGQIVDGFAECIGWGEQSALKYLCSFLIPLNEQFNTEQAERVGAYIVSVAGRFVQKCGGFDSMVLHDNGMIGERKRAVFSNQKELFLSCEEQMGKELRNFLFKGGGSK